MPLSVHVLTPEKLVLEKQADSVSLPASDGELGILPHHAPLFVQMQPGQIRLRHGDEVEFFAVSGGFAEVKNNEVTIFAETAEMAQDIDAERARQAAQRAGERAKAAKSEVELAQAEAALRRALARLKAFEGFRRTRRSPPQPIPPPRGGRVQGEGEAFTACLFPRK